MPAPDRRSVAVNPPVIFPTYARKQRARFGNVTISDDLSLLGSFIAGPRFLTRFGGEAPLNTDDRPIVAYRAPNVTYVPSSTPRERLVELLRDTEISPAELLIDNSNASTSGWQTRLRAYWMARNQFIEAGRNVRPSSDVRGMLAQVREPLLSVFRTSPDFRPAYDPLLRMAAALSRVDRDAARSLLGELQRAQPCPTRDRTKVAVPFHGSGAVLTFALPHPGQGAKMKKIAVVVMAAACLGTGIGIGYAAKAKGPGMTLITGKSPKEAGIASLKEAERLAEGGSWELIQIARVYYLSGDKATGQAMLDKVLNGKSEGSDWFRIARVYAEAGENAKAEELFLRALAADPKDDSGHAEVGAWYIRIGQRDKGEELLAKAFARNADEIWHYVRAGEAFMGVPAK